EAPAEPEIVEAKTIVPPSVRLVPRAPVEPSPAPKTPARKAPAAAPAEDPTAWETELNKLNMKAGQHDILRGVPAGKPAAKDDGSGESDLMSMLENDLTAIPDGPGDLGAAPSPATEKAALPAANDGGAAASEAATTGTPAK